MTNLFGSSFISPEITGKFYVAKHFRENGNSFHDVSTMRTNLSEDITILDVAYDTKKEALKKVYELDKPCYEPNEAFRFKIGEKPILRDVNNPPPFFAYYVDIFLVRI